MYSTFYALQTAENEVVGRTVQINNAEVERRSDTMHQIVMGVFAVEKIDIPEKHSRAIHNAIANAVAAAHEKNNNSNSQSSG